MLTHVFGMEQIERDFTHRKPDEDTQPRFELVNDGLKQAAKTLVTAVPPGPDRDEAYKLLLACRMWANRGIVMGLS